MLNFDKPHERAAFFEGMLRGIVRAAFSDELTRKADEVAPALVALLLPKVAAAREARTTFNATQKDKAWRDLLAKLERKPNSRWVDDALPKAPAGFITPKKR